MLHKGCVFTEQSVSERQTILTSILSISCKYFIFFFCPTVFTETIHREDGHSLTSSRDIDSFSLCYSHLDACYTSDQLSCQTNFVDSCQYCHSCLLHS